MDNGFVIIAACMDECFTNLSRTVKQWFTDMGSLAINHLKYRSSFAFIGFYNTKDRIG